MTGVQRGPGSNSSVYASPMAVFQSVAPVLRSRHRALSWPSASSNTMTRPPATTGLA